MYMLSDLIKHIEKDIKSYGDLRVLSFNIIDEEHGNSMRVNSPTKLDKNGNKKKATLKEFKVMVEKSKIKALDKPE